MPRDAFFGPAEQVSADHAPGAPAVLPGEVPAEPILDYLRSGLAAGMELPDPADAELKSIRVVARG